MEIDEILLKELSGSYKGYTLTRISISLFTPKDLAVFKRLQRIPHKITYFLDRSKIKSAYKSDCFKDPLDNYYLVQAIDNTIFHLRY